MGRLENIIARDKERRRMTAKKVVWIGVGVLVLFTAIALLFTDLGMPKQPPAPAADPQPAGGEHHIDGVQLRRAR